MEIPPTKPSVVEAESENAGSYTFTGTGIDLESDPEFERNESVKEKVMLRLGVMGRVNVFDVVLVRDPPLLDSVGDVVLEIRFIVTVIVSFVVRV